MKPVVFSDTSAKNIEARLQAVRRDGIAPTLAIVFTAPSNNLDDLCAVFGAHGIAVFGACSNGEFTHEGVSEDSVAVMLLDIPQQAFQVDIFDHHTGDPSLTGRNIARWAKKKFNNPALLVISSGLHASGEQIISEIILAADGPIPLYGGFTGLQTGDTKSFIFTSERIAPAGIIGLVFNRDLVDLHGVAASGWKGVGTPKIITKAEDNVIFQIDDEPALDMYNKYLNIGDDPSLAYEYPLLLLRDDGSSILRGSVTINDDKSITYGGAVPQGAKVRFSIPPGMEIIDRAVDIVSQLKHDAPVADAVILFSCKGRQFTLGPMVADEISAVHRLWNAPLIGFFTDGEIGPVPNGRCELHNHTLVPVVIRQTR